MLSKKDKEWLYEAIKSAVRVELEVTVRDMVEKAVVKALTVEMTWEKVLDDKTGMPLASKELRKEDVFLPSFWTQHLKYHEGVYRGMRKVLGEQRSRLSQSSALNKGVIRKLEQVRKVFKGLQDTLLVMNRFASALEESGVVDKLETALSIDVGQIEDRRESSTQ